MGDTTYDLIKQSNENSRAAAIQQAVEGRKRVCFSVTIDLTTAQTSTSPLELAFPFRTYWVQDATDSTAEAFLVPNPHNEGNLNAAIPVHKNDSARLDNPVSGGYLYWTEQSGKSMTIFFFVDADVRPGSMINTIAGGVSISDGSSLSSANLDSTGDQASVTITSAAVQEVCPSDTDRKLLEIYFSGPVWLGDSSVAVGTRGIYWPGGLYEYKNSAALYAIAVGADVTATGNHHS